MTLTTPSEEASTSVDEATWASGPSADWVAALALGLVVAGRDDDAGVEELLTAAHRSRRILTAARSRVTYVEAVDDEAPRRATRLLTSALDRVPGGDPAAGAFA